ncbi:recombinase family protein [Agromyces silvae]|uniref:recombinase family protein n=1 Tax=Agromyces silvae TaxID=3388266 RepID=UPI00280B1C10|nr:recombinase family protein [Agromyces protaetiae]
MTRVALYLRQSSDPQGTELAVDRQRVNCLARAAAKGWSVDPTRIYIDNNVSATSARERPAYQRLIADVMKRDVDVVIAWNLDRLTRKPREVEDWIDLNEKFGVNLMTSEGTDPVDMSTEVGRLVLRITAAVARQEVERKGRRQRESNAQARELGYPPHGTRAFGYTARKRDARSITALRTGADGKEYLDYGYSPIPDEAEVIRAGYELVIKGETLGAVARAWNAAGVLNTRGNRWVPTTVLAILTNPRYAGYSVPPRGQHAWRKSLYHPEDLTKHRRGTWEPIVDAATWTATQSLIRDLSARDLLGTPKRWLLSGIATCAADVEGLACGAPIIGGATYSKVPTYRCSVAGHLMRRADLAEELVVAEIMQLALGADGLSLAQFAPDLALTARERSLMKSLHEVNDEYDVLVRTGVLTETEGVKKARTRRGRLRAELLELRRELRGLRVDALNLLLRAGKPRPSDGKPWTSELRVKKVWAELPLSAKRHVVQTTMKVSLSPPGRGNGHPGPRPEDRLALAAKSVHITLRQMQRRSAVAPAGSPDEGHTPGDSLY